MDWCHSSLYWAAKTWQRLRGEMKPKMIFFFSGFVKLLGGPPLLLGLLPLQPALHLLWKHRGYNNPSRCSPVDVTSAPCWPGETWQHRSKLLHRSSLQFSINRLNASFQPLNNKRVFSTLRMKNTAVLTSSRVSGRTTSLMITAVGSDETHSFITVDHMTSWVQQLPSNRNFSDVKSPKILS